MKKEIFHFGKHASHIKTQSKFSIFGLSNPQSIVVCLVFVFGAGLVSYSIINQRGKPPPQPQQNTIQKARTLSPYSWMTDEEYAASKEYACVKRLANDRKSGKENELVGVYCNSAGEYAGLISNTPQPGNNAAPSSKNSTQPSLQNFFKTSKLSASKAYLFISLNKRSLRYSSLSSIFKTELVSRRI